MLTRSEHYNEIAGPFVNDSAESHANVTMVAMLQYHWFMAIKLATTRNETTIYLISNH